MSEQTTIEGTRNAGEWTDFSIDVETLGKKINAPVLTIGVTAFKLETGEIGPKFYQRVGVASAIKAGVVDADTLLWWMGQNDTARKEAFDGEDRKDREPLATALYNMVQWMRKHGIPMARPWGNGIMSDIAWLEYAIMHGGHGIEAPWRFSQVRDMRTLVEAAQVLRGFENSSIPDEKIAHHAQHDSTWQAKCICACWAALRGGEPVPTKAPEKKRSTKPIPAPAVSGDDDEY